MNASFPTSPYALRCCAARKLARVAIVGLCAVAGSAAVHAAETTGRVFGQAPSGATVQVSSPEFAIHRTIPVQANGRYEATWLPIGIYDVTVVDDGQATVMHPRVQVFVDRGSRVDFGCPSGQCADLAAD